MYQNDMSLGYDDDIAEAFADFLIENNLQITVSNKKDVLEAFEKATFQKNYTEDLHTIAKIFTPFIPELTRIIIEKYRILVQNKSKFIHIFSDELSADIRPKFWGSGFNYTDEAFNVYINSKIPLEDGQVYLQRTYDGDGRYDWSLEILYKDAIYWTDLETRIQNLYAQLEDL